MAEDFIRDAARTPPGRDAGGFAPVGADGPGAFALGHPPGLSLGVGQVIGRV